MWRTWALLALVACGQAEQRFEERSDAWLERMDEIDAEAVALRDELVQGDLGSVKAHARRLRDRLPTEGRPATLDTALDHLEAATTVREATRAVGELTQGCRACHAANHASLALRDTTQTTVATGEVGAEMARHRALVDGVWFTMIGGPTEAMHDAVQVLDQGSLVEGAVVAKRRAPDVVLGPAAAALDARVHQLAHEIEGATWDHRPPLYADLLATCADCHTLARTRGALAAAPPAPPKMNDHFVDVVLLELGVMGGDLDAARKAAESLSGARADLPPAWAPSFATFTAAATRATEAKDLDAMGAATAQVLVACGTCHRATGGGPTEPVQEPPPADAPEMARHLYAAYWMGHGLLAPSDEAWTRGAAALADAPLAPPAGTSTGREAKVHDLGAQATRATDTTERAKVFGQLLAACAPCHQEAFPQR